jgi:endonuclease-3
LKIWDILQKHRASSTAPVDELGASSLVKSYDDVNLKAYHTLIGLMLSSQTKDEVTHSTLRYLVEEKKLSID